MIDIRTEEDAALYVLDLLNGLDRQRFEARLESEPDLTQYVRKLADDTALLALNAPRLDAPANAYARITQAIRQQPQSRPKNILIMINRIPAAWPMAACLFLTFTVLFLLADRGGMSDLITMGSNGHTIPSISYDIRNRLAKLEELEKANQLKEDELRAKQDALLALESKLDATEDEAQATERERQLLARKLQKMTEIETLYRTLGPGVARLTVMDLTDSPNIVPDVSLYTGINPADFSKQPTEVMTMGKNFKPSLVGTATDTVPVGPVPAATATPVDEPITPQVIIDEVNSLNARLAASGATVTQLGNANLSSNSSINSDSFATGKVNSVNDGNLYTTVPAATPDPTPEPPATNTSDDVSQYAPSGTVIFDGNNGKLLLWDVPDPEAGYNYVGYIVDPKFPTPIRAGAIQDLDHGSGSFLFTPAEQGLNPTNFFIQKEPVTGGSGTIILSGDWKKP